MNRLTLRRQSTRDLPDNGVLVRRLEREISCLERQLDRITLLDGSVDQRTQDTYQEMIASRRNMLSELVY